jgi:hypothetical protein
MPILKQMMNTPLNTPTAHNSDHDTGKDKGQETSMFTTSGEVPDIWEILGMIWRQTF